MSVRLIQCVWERFPVGGARLSALLAIAEAANEQGNCYTPIAQLAAAARLSRSSALRAVNQLREDRWIVTSRMLGHGALLVYQLNQPKLERSVREGYDPASTHMQRVRLVGATEAGLEARVRPRGPECQSDTATQSDTEGQSDTGAAASLIDGPAAALEETVLPRQDVEEGKEEPKECFKRADGSYHTDRAEFDRWEAWYTEGNSGGTEVCDDPSGSLHGAATSLPEGDFEAGDTLDGFDDEIAAMKVQAERASETR